MKLVSTHLALFIATLVATTAQPLPRGSSVNSLRRALKGEKGSKGKGGGDKGIQGTDFVEQEDTTGDDFQAFEENQDTDQDIEADMQERLEFADATCKMLETFDNMGRRENNDRSIPGFEWDLLCDDFESLNVFLCPLQENIAGICSHTRPYLNNAVKEFWCIPTYMIIADKDRRDDCIQYCVHYVSEDRGGCCNIECVYEP